LIFHPDISSEIQDSYNWYQKQAEGLGDDFIKELDSAYQAIIRFPKAWAVFHKGFRRYLLARFPYSVIYLANTDIIYVVAVMHNHRKPGYWLNRL
jgi:plasmid stabilization system protein ParE